MNDLPQDYLTIDESGIPLLGDVRISDPVIGSHILHHLAYAENGAVISSLPVAGGQIRPVVVEAFDEPLIAKKVTPLPNLQKIGAEDTWFLDTSFSVQRKFSLRSLCADEWDRFHGVSEEGIPFVMSRTAQSEFFELLDEFDDNSITISGQKIEISPLYAAQEPVEQEKFWTEIYQSKEAPWDLGAPAAALVETLPSLKIPKARVLVLGSGPGHDAAFFAEHGHLVTAVDISAEAIAQAKKRYEHLTNIRWVHADIFQLPSDWNGQFDLVFEHTCYCAIPPERRPDLVKIWKKMLVDRGQILGVFFTMKGRFQPPFGASEWELRRRFEKDFHFLLWARWRKSVPARQGKELFLLVQKR